MRKKEEMRERKKRKENYKGKKKTMRKSEEK